MGDVGFMLEIPNVSEQVKGSSTKEHLCHTGKHLLPTTGRGMGLRKRKYV